MMVGLGSGVGVGVLVGKAACEDLDRGPKASLPAHGMGVGYPKTGI